MLHIAHRGCIDKENTIDGILASFEKFTTVEIDVRYNSSREIVLCHDREKRNEKNERFIDLCKIETTMHLLVDIKAFGIATAEQLARDIVSAVQPYPQHTYEFCSFNEYCVQELIKLSRNLTPRNKYRVGVISSGLSVGLFERLEGLDFVSFNYDTIHEEILDKLCGKYTIYAWVCNDDSVKYEMEHRYKLDGIIYDHVSQTDSDSVSVSISKVDIKLY